MLPAMSANSLGARNLRTPRRQVHFHPEQPTANDAKINRGPATQTECAAALGKATVVAELLRTNQPKDGSVEDESSRFGPIEPVIGRVTPNENRESSALTKA